MPATLRAQRAGGADLAMLALIGVLTLVSLSFVLAPRLAPATVNPELDAAFLAVSTLVAAALAGLFWVRYREGEPSSALVRASAFAVLFAANLPQLVVTLLGASDSLGMSLEDPGQMPILMGITGRMVAAALLVLAGAAGLRSPRSRSARPAALVLGPAVLVLALLGVAALSQDGLPPLLTPEGTQQLRDRPDEPLTGAALAPGVMVVQLLAAAGYLLAAAYSWRLFRRDRRTSEALLAAGLVLAAFGQANFAIHPGAYAGLVTVGDVLRVGFYGLLLFSLGAASSEDVRALRLAHDDLRRLRDAELTGVAL
jgi:hypothetical protein